MKKLISLILSVIMIFSCCAVMASAAQKDFGHLPQIYIEGFESKGVYYKEDVKQENPLFFPINGDMMISNLMKYEDILARAVFEKDLNLLTNYLTIWINDCFGDVALKEDGFTVSDKVYVPETELNYRGNGKYVFRYDCRLDPVDIAKELYESYIPWVLSDCGYDRFELVASSYGSGIALALINEYPDMVSKIDSLLLCVPSVNGVNFAGELFSGQVNVDAKALKNFLSGMVGDDAITALISTLVKTGSLDFLLESLVNPALNALLVDAIRNVIINVFGTMPSMWSFVDERYFEDALTNVYGPEGSELRAKYAGLIERVKYYHYNIMVRSSEIMTNAKNAGIKTNLVTKYGINPLPISKEGNFMGDGFVRLEVASFGAVSSMHQQKLPTDYQQAKHPEKNYMSPDWCIDASTCLIPDNTWFIRNLNHGVKPDGYYELLNTIVYNDITIDSDARFPQFLVVPDYDDEQVIPLATYEEPSKEPEKETTWWQDFIDFITGFFPRLIEMIKGWFAK